MNSYIYSLPQITSNNYDQAKIGDESEKWVVRDARQEKWGKRYQDSRVGTLDVIIATHFLVASDASSCIVTAAVDHQPG